MMAMFRISMGCRFGERGLIDASTGGGNFWSRGFLTSDHTIFT
jgi:hypothetical protein